MLHVLTRSDFSGRMSYGRTTNGGASWSQVRHFNRHKYQAQQAAVAAAGSRVHVAWVHRTGVGHVLYVMTNDTYGSSSHWSTYRRLGKVATLTGQDSWLRTPAGRISIAATGSTVVVTGRFHRDIVVWSSRDAGAHWVRRSIATTQVPDDGLVSTAAGARGRLIAVAWTGSGSTVRAKVSVDGGRRWSATRTSGRATPKLEQAQMPGLSLSLDRDRVVVAGSTAPELGSVRVWTHTWRQGRWGPVRDMPASPGTVGAPVVLLHGRNQVGVAYQSASGSPAVGQGKTLWWQVSGDEGRTWSGATEVWRVPRSAAGDPVLEYTAIWRSTGAIHVLASGTTAPDPEWGTSSTVVRSHP